MGYPPSIVSSVKVGDHCGEFEVTPNFRQKKTAPKSGFQ